MSYSKRSMVHYEYILRVILCLIRFIMSPFFELIYVKYGSFRVHSMSYSMYNMVHYEYVL